MIAVCEFGGPDKHGLPYSGSIVRHLTIQHISPGQVLEIQYVRLKIDTNSNCEDFDTGDTSLRILCSRRAQTLKMSGLLKQRFELATQAASHWLALAASQGSQVAIDFTKDHPYRVLYVAVNTGFVMVVGPQGIFAIPLEMLGFGHLGPVGGS